MRDLLDDRPIKLRRDRSGAPAGLRVLVIAFALCLLVGALLFFDRQGRLAFLHQPLQYAAATSATVLSGLRNTVSDSLDGPWGQTALELRIAALERENSRLSDELLRREQAEVENVFLRQQLAIEREQPWSLVGAEVTVRSPDAGRRIMLLARGQHDGLSPGMAVIGQLRGGPTGLVGIVESVGPNTAQVLLITDIGSQISGRVIHDGRAGVGLVRGQWQRGSRLRIEQVDRATPLAIGDPVVTAGLTAALNLPFDLAAVPPNIPIGSIEQVGTSEQYQHAELRPFVDPDQVRYVWVILSQDD